MVTLPGWNRKRVIGKTTDLKKKSLLLTKGTYIKSGTGTQRGEKRRWILVNQLYLELKLTKLPKTKTYPS